MKKLIYLLGVSLCLLTTMVAQAQKYKVLADTVKLNKEYLQVTSEVASLSEKLGKAQNDPLKETFEKLVIRSSFGIINAGRNSA